MGSKRTNERDFYPALVAVVDPVEDIYFLLTVHYFNSFVPIAQHARQATVLGRLSLSMCLWFYLFSQFYRKHFVGGCIVD